MFLETIDDSEQHVVLVSDLFDGKSGTWLVFARADQVGHDGPSVPHWVDKMARRAPGRSGSGRRGLSNA